MINTLCPDIIKKGGKMTNEMILRINRISTSKNGKDSFFPLLPYCDEQLDKTPMSKQSNSTTLSH
jgi:hypothetical protein